MFRVTIKDLQGKATHGGTFKTAALAQNWIDESLVIGHWGIPGQYTIENEDITVEVEAKRQVKVARNNSRAVLRSLTGVNLNAAQLKIVVEEILNILNLSDENTGPFVQ